ncbi:MAG: family 43 glycosylhydrolase [Lachnospiraceae bacterium]|nr:family 43 glycosylhydrolase [Lachnospiraceae bacterium]
MVSALVYTRKGEKYYYSGNDGNYPGLRAENCDVFDALHLALSRDGKNFVPMRNNTGILFAKADFLSGVPGGITRTLIDPWVFRHPDGSFGLCAVRRGQNCPDPTSTGCMVLFRSDNLVTYQEVRLLKLADQEIRHPKCRFQEDRNMYCIEWETKEGLYRGFTRHFLDLSDITPLDAPSFESVKDCGIVDAVLGNTIEISEEEAKIIEGYLGEISNIGVEPLYLEVETGATIDLANLPKAICRYNDGSSHKKAVRWDMDALSGIDTAKPGEYEIHGEIQQTDYPFPFLSDHISDPCICNYHGRYFLSASGQHSVTFRISDTLKGLPMAKPITVYSFPESDTHANIWAQEMHVINGVPYVFTTVGEREWYTVRSHVLRCNGDPANKNDWEAPRPVCKPDGTELEPDGISLDMTYFCVGGVHYVMWSNRKFPKRTKTEIVADSADIYIATIDPAQPWQLTTNPVCILRPMYGWDRYETPVDEGPYLLRHGNDLFVTISGSSTGLADLYCIGLLHAKQDANLLSPESWEWLPYPILTKESIPGEYGPGHNCFIRDQESGDDLLVYHAVPHAKDGKTLGRHMGIRRVHWAANGYPYLEMTKERDLNPAYKNVTLKISVRRPSTKNPAAPL